MTSDVRTDLQTADSTFCQQQHLTPIVCNVESCLCTYLVQLADSARACGAQEWFHFVDKEKQVRIRIDAKVDQMVAEAAELKQWTLAEVPCDSLSAIIFASG